MSHALTLPATDMIVQRTVSLLDRLFPLPRAFGVRLWDGTELPAVGCPTFRLVLKHPGAMRRMFTPPIELSLGEAFIYGDFDIEGDIFSAFPVMDRFASRAFSPGDLIPLPLDLLALPDSRPARPQNARGRARLRGALHSRERDRAAIQYHYDVGNDFYALWLDHHMQYSCAYFPTGAEDLETAQERKLEHICRKLRLKPSERLLDIGCGWGGLAMYAARSYGVRVLGVTLSEAQANYANLHIVRADLGKQASVKLRDYRDLGAESFDKIVSVGMFEHVGRSHLPEYFAQAYRLLKPGGLFLNHGISRRAPIEFAMAASQKLCCPPTLRAQGRSGWQKFVESHLLGSGAFAWRHVFPDGELSPLSEINAVAEAAGFEVRDVENLREHYALTLRQWVNRLAARQAEATNLVGEATYRTWRLYLAASAHGFETGEINVNQTLLAKLADGQANVPYSRADMYA